MAPGLRKPPRPTRPASYAGRFRSHFGHPRQAIYCGAYLQGLLLDGERKSIEPMARRVHLPDGQRPADPDQALQQFLGQSPWDDRAVMATYRSTMIEAFGSPAGILVIDDTGLSKQGKHPFGVGHQYCGAPGKQANCQVACSLHYVGPRAHFPLAMRLHLPRKWVEDADRIDRAGVPADARRMRTEGELALDLIDRVRAEGVPGRLVVADAGYGISQPLRDGPAERGLHYIVGVTGEMVVFQAEPPWDDPTPRPAGVVVRRLARSWPTGRLARSHWPIWRPSCPGARWVGEKGPRAD